MTMKKSESSYPKPVGRKEIPPSIRRAVLEEAGFKCANPTCRAIITLHIHHLYYVSHGGSNDPDNLLALCGYCHDNHHQRVIPNESLRTWKMILLTLNHGFDRRSLDLLLFLDRLNEPNFYITPDGLLEFASLVASRLVDAEKLSPYPNWRVFLSEKGKLFIEGWRSGDERGALESLRPNAEEQESKATEE